MTSHFSGSYEQARERFRKAAVNAGGELSSIAVNGKSNEDLTIDVASVGSAQAEKTLLLTSGIHGVEGFFGSAVQLALLESFVDQPVTQDLRVVLIHAINPHGFRHMRRVNENNIDLNRNFPECDHNYAGAPQGYRLHNRFLNPQAMPSRFELFKLKAAWKIWRHGMDSLKESIAGGQYEYPDGLFYGGQAVAESSKVIVKHLKGWLGNAYKVVHIDLHTGLGAYGDYKLLVNESEGSNAHLWAIDTFGKRNIETLGESGGTVYPVSGVFGAWCQRHNHALDYRFLGAEFGTYNVVRVLNSLREENCAHRFEPQNSVRYRAAKQELLECFCPADASWRQRVIDSALNVVLAARAGL